jgi:hypothetical protein
MTIHQGLESLRVPFLDADHQLIVVEHMIPRLPIPAGVEMMRC